MDQEELLYILALQHVPNLGDRTAKKLIRKIGSAKDVLNTRKDLLLKIDGVGKAKLSGFEPAENLKQAQRELEFIQKYKISTHYYLDANYPEALKHCKDGPILLFSKGNISLESKRVISIVGTRKVSAHGVAFCEELIADLSIFDPVIVSGFAYGVDITAHKAALKNGLPTVACLAHGLNQIYPKSHKKYVQEVMENGGFFTDFWSSDDFDRNNFLKRNRIIAGLSEATIVIESAEKGGSLVTADIANSYDREVFAVPGRPGDFQSSGCNNLIKMQQAHLLHSAADLIYLLNWNAAEKSKPIQKELFAELNAQEQLVYDYLEKGGKQVLDEIAIKCQIPAYKMASILLEMELKNVIRPLPGKLFEAI